MPDRASYQLILRDETSVEWRRGERGGVNIHLIPLIPLRIEQP